MTASSVPLTPPQTGSSAAQSHMRWSICALLFFATVIAYVDRGVLGYLKETLQHIVGWDAVGYSKIAASFKVGYGIGLVTAGWFTDRLGTRKGFAIAIVLWSLAAMSPAKASSVLTFGLAMFFLGLGEAANFPACIKTIAEWFPKRERALATGIFNSGCNIANILVPLIVPAITYRLGWQGAFVATGATGFIWLVFWLTIYRKPDQHKSVSAAELAYIQSDPPDRLTKVPWGRLIGRKETWAFAVAKAFTDPVWWFYLFWLPGYMQETFGLNLNSNRLPVMVIYAISCVGSVAGGWLSGALFKGGRSLNAARKITMLICALAVLPVLYAPYARNVWVVVALVGLATAAHQGWSANLFTLASDLFPKAAVASVVGIGGMVAAIAAAFFDVLTGHVVKWTHSYVPIFVVCGLAYVVALGLVHLISPGLEPAKLE